MKYKKLGTHYMGVIIYVIIGIAIIGTVNIHEVFTQERAPDKVQEQNKRYERLIRGLEPAETIERFILTFEAQVNDDNVRVRAMPLLEEGTILGKVNRGDRIVVLGKSSFIDRIGDSTARWLQIEWKRRRGWIYGTFVDLKDSNIEDIPVVVVIKDSDKLKKNLREDVPMRKLTVPDLDEMIRRYENNIRGETAIIGSSTTNVDRNNKIRDFRMEWSWGGFRLDSYEEKYGGSLSTSPLAYKGYIILLLQEGYSRQDGKGAFYFIVDYKVIPNTANYQPVADIDEFGEYIKIDGEFRRGSFPTITMIIGEKEIEYDEPREDVIVAYVVDIGTKQYVEIPGTNLAYTSYEFSD